MTWMPELVPLGARSREEIFFAWEMRTSLCQPFASAVVSIDNRPLNGPGPRVRVPEALVPASRGGDVGRAVVLRHEHIRPVAAVLWSLVIGLLAARCTAQLG